MTRPDEVLDPSDPGDDMQRRLRYQATRAVMLGLSLLDEGAETEEVFCEHHEDVLIKKRGDRFIGEQVKSKLDEAGPMKAIDEGVAKSIRRFVALERRHGWHFDGYILATNAGFWNEDKTTSSLPHILTLAASSNGNVPKKVTDYLKKLFPKPRVRKKKGPASCDGSQGKSATADDGQTPDPLEEWEKNMEAGVIVLRKLKATVLPSLRDMRAALIEMLPKFIEVGDRFYSELGMIADALIAEVLKASALDPDYAVDRYLGVFDDPDQIMTNEVLRGKRITRSRLLTIIQLTLPAAPDLRTSEIVSVGDLPKGMSILEKKLAAGGLSIGNIGLAKDQKLSTEHLLTQWLHKNGKESTDGRYQHLRTLVRTECQEAYDEAQEEDEVFGPQMLSDIRTRLRTRHRVEGESLGCRYEHLLGMAGILTEDCTLWWSEEFNISEEGDDESL